MFGVRAGAPQGDPQSMLPIKEAPNSPGSFQSFFFLEKKENAGRTYINMKLTIILCLLLLSLLIEAAPVEKRATYHGTGTWFDPVSEGGPTGSCGPQENDNSLIVALNHEQYGNMNAKSKWCGKKITVKGTHGSMKVTINDACPGCGYGDLVSCSVTRMCLLQHDTIELG